MSFRYFRGDVCEMIMNNNILPVVDSTIISFWINNSERTDELMASLSMTDYSRVLPS